jgi:hypothetical protein
MIRVDSNNVWICVGSNKLWLALAAATFAELPPRAKNQALPSKMVSQARVVVTAICALMGIAPATVELGKEPLPTLSR